MLKSILHPYAQRWPLKTASCIIHGFGAAVGAAILTSGLIGHNFLQTQHEQASKQYETSVALISAGDPLQTEMQAMHRQLAAATEQQAQARARIPSVANEIEFLEELSLLADEVGLQIRDYRPGLRQEFPTHQEIELTLRAEGSYPKLCRFLAGLTELPRACRVASLNVVAPSASQPKLLIEMKVSLAYGLKSATTI